MLMHHFLHASFGGSLTIMGPARAGVASSDPSALPINLTTIALNDDPQSINPQGWGPLNMIYEQPAGQGDLKLFTTPTTAPSASTVTGRGYRGIRLATGDKPVMLTALGRYCLPGNSRSHHLIVQRVIPTSKADSTEDPDSLDKGGRASQVLAQALVPANWDQANNSADPNSDGYNYTILEQPVVLEPHTRYYLASYEEYPGDSYATGGTAAYCSAASSVLGYSGNLTYSDANDQNSVFNSSNDFMLDQTSVWTNIDGLWSYSNGFTPNVNFKVR